MGHFQCGGIVTYGNESIITLCKQSFYCIGITLPKGMSLLFILGKMEVRDLKFPGESQTLLSQQSENLITPPYNLALPFSFRGIRKNQ